VSEIQPSNMRISDAEREDAIGKLGEHMTQGRLDVDEYGERSAKATTAKTRGELLELFADLPDPRPGLTTSTPNKSALAPRVERREPVSSWEERPLAQRLWAGLAPLSAIAALVVFLFVVKFWPVFLLPAIVMIVGHSLWGDDWRHDRRDFERRMRHRRHCQGGWSERY
jgi:hypothetical protein